MLFLVVFMRPAAAKALAGKPEAKTPLPEWYFDKDVSLVNRKINNDVMVAGGTVVIDKDTVVNGYLLTAGGDVKIDGEIGKNLIVAGGKVVISSSAKINGYVVAVGGQVEISPEAKISGERFINQGNWEAKPKQNNKSFDLFGVLSGAVSLMLLIKIFKCCSEKYWTAGKKNFWKTILLGLKVSILAPLALILAMITIVGIPVGFIGLMLYGISMYVAQLIAAWGIGKWLVETKVFNVKNEYALAILGLVLLSALKWIPGIGAVTAMAAGLWGLGIIWSKRQ